MPSFTRYVLSAPLATLLLAGVQAHVEPIWFVLDGITTFTSYTVLPGNAGTIVRDATPTSETTYYPAPTTVVPVAPTSAPIEPTSVPIAPTFVPEHVNARRQVQPLWTATTACTTQNYDASAASNLKYYVTSYWNDVGVYTTSLAVLGARVAYDDNGFPVTILPNNAGEVFCTTSVSYYSQPIQTVQVIDPSALQTTQIVAVVPTDLSSTVTVELFSPPVAGTEYPSSSNGGRATSTPQVMGSSASTARFGLFDPILFTLAGLGVGFLAVVAVL